MRNLIETLVFTLIVSIWIWKPYCAFWFGGGGRAVVKYCPLGAFCCPPYKNCWAPLVIGGVPLATNFSLKIAQIWLKNNIFPSKRYFFRRFGRRFWRILSIYANFLKGVHFLHGIWRPLKNKITKKRFGRVPLATIRLYVSMSVFCCWSAWTVGSI